MTMRQLLFVCLCQLTCACALAQPAPNLGDKLCPLWTLHREAASTGKASSPFPDVLEWWVWGYLRGMSDQYSFESKEPSVLFKLSPGEELRWMDSYCLVNKTKTMANGAVALLEELASRPNKADNSPR